jgi:arsenate reductase
MTQMTLYGLKSCDTCKKALKALEAAGHTVAFMDVRTEADLPAKVPAWLSAVGSDRLINTRSTTWRGLDDGERALADSDASGLLQNHPTLIKRPVIEAGGEILVGWAKDVQAALGV